MGNKWPSKKLRKLVRKELCNWVKPLLLKKNGKLVDNLVWLSKTRSSFLEKAFYECGALNSSLWNNKISSWKMISSIKNRATDLNNYHIPNKGPTRLYNDQFKKAKQDEIPSQTQNLNGLLPSPALTNCLVLVSSCLSNFWLQQRTFESFELLICSPRTSQSFQMSCWDNPSEHCQQHSQSNCQARKTSKGFLSSLLFQNQIKIDKV